MLLYSYCNGFKNNNFWGFILTMWYVKDDPNLPVYKEFIVLY